MTSPVVSQQVGHITAVRGDASAAAPMIESALVAVRRVRAWADAQEAALVCRLTELSSFPAGAIADAGKCSLHDANRTKERAETLSRTPGLAGALDDGDITARHVDAVTRGAKQLDDERRREELFERLDDLVDVAAAATAEQFERRVKLEIRQLQSDDGDARLTRQRRSVRASSWTDAEGMWNLRGRFDPITGVELAAALDRTVQRLFSETTPELCPSDAIEKQRFLAGHALARLVRGAASVSSTGSSADSPAGSSADSPAGSSAGSSARCGVGSPEYVVVIDADAADQPGPVAEWPIPVEVPASVLAHLAVEAEINAVVVRNGVVLYAPGMLDLGRSTRLASRDQRRALRAMYRSCAIPGCGVRFDRCKVHHIDWWRHGGLTDLDNLVPVCVEHHARIHHDDWKVELGSRRELTVRFPDGTVRSTGPRVDG
jgi:hypothetical protein